MKPQSTLKALATALQPLPNRALRSCVAAALILHFTLYTLHSPAAEPLCWERKPNQPAPAQFDTFHGASLDLCCTFTGFGALPFDGASDVRLWYQTNGMGAAWWSIPATVSSNVLAATFPPGADPGAERLSVFFGAPSNAYAAAQVRFRNSPGATPNDLAPPSILDWQAELAAATNALWESSAAAFMPKTDAYTKVETDARITELAPRTSLEPATNYTDAAVSALSNAIPYIVTNEVVTAWSDDWYLVIDEEIFDTDYEYVRLDEMSWHPNFDEYPEDGGYWQVVIRWRYKGEEYEGDEEEEFIRSFYAETKDELTEILDDELPVGISLIRRPASTRNALGLARPSDITNTVTKAYVEGLGIESGVSEATVTNVVRSVAYAVNDYMWDGDVCWRRQMLKGGYLECVAVTNIDVTRPENYKALEALEKARRNQE